MPTELEEVSSFRALGPSNPHSTNSKHSSSWSSYTTEILRSDKLVGMRSLLREASSLAKFTLAAEHLVPYSEKEPSIFKASQLNPVKDLKLLVKDYPVRAGQRDFYGFG